MRHVVLLSAVLLAAASALTAAPPDKAVRATKAPPAPGSPGSPTNFSGIWELDVHSSSGGAPNLKDAVLEVTQKGERIWIQPLGESRKSVLAEEVVVDGQTYEKGVGQARRGTLQAQWGKDGKSLWLEVVAPSEENPRAAVQRTVWRLSDDRNTWVRSTVTIVNGQTRQSRLVFHRLADKKSDKKADKKKAK
ncbi:MAG TPA: hypothetical protein VIZ69_12010 [Thermoanaerobaculia bacterium]